MTRERALMALGAKASRRIDTETLSDLLEEKCHELATYFFRRAFVPALAEKKIEALQMLQQAAEVLELAEVTTGAEPVPIIDFPDRGLAEILQAYHKAEAMAKLKLNAARLPLMAIAAYRDWLDQFYAFAKAYTNCYLQMAVASGIDAAPDPGVKLSESADTTRLLTELNQSAQGAAEAYKLYSRLMKMGKLTL